MTDRELREKSDFGIRLDHTQMDHFRECPRKFYFFSRRLVDKETPDYFISGGAWQEGLVEWYKSHDVLKAQAAIYSYYQKRALPGMVIGEKRSAHNVALLMERYAATYAEESFDVVGMELGFELEMVKDYLIFCGALDGYISWPYIGNLAIENKTTAGWLTQNWMDSWNLNWQITGYAWAVRELTGESAGCLVNGACLDIPKRATTERNLFARSLQERSNEALDDFEQEVYNIKEDIEREKKRWHWPKRGRFCFGGYGLKPCAYRAVCLDDFRPLHEINIEMYPFLKEAEPWEPWKREGKVGEE